MWVGTTSETDFNSLSQVERTSERTKKRRKEEMWNVFDLTSLGSPQDFEGLR